MEPKRKPKNPAAVLLGKRSAASRFRGLTRAQISRRMAKVRKAASRRKLAA